MATATAPTELRTEADVVKTLRAGTYTLDELYALVQDRVDVTRDGGLDAINDSTDTRWRRRVRGALQQLRARGDGHRVARSCWAIDGTPDQPRRMILIHGGGSVADFELRVQDAVRTLRELTEPADVVVTDPPWGLRRDHGPEAERLASLYGNRCVVPGYVDVDPAGYEEFTQRWVTEAAGALRSGGQLVVVTGPQQAAVVQIAAQHAGLTFVSSIAARRDFPLYTTRRPSFAHWTITTMVRGSLRHPRRVWNTPPDLPKAASGADYPLDVWEHNGRCTRGRAGLLVYDNTLPPRLAGRVIYGFSDPGELVVDPFVGGGAIAQACMTLGRRFIGADVNPHAVRFTAARLLTDCAWPAERAPQLALTMPEHTATPTFAFGNAHPATTNHGDT